MQKFNTVVCGGTFDHFHKGHEEFIRFALSYGKKIIIGLTSEKYVQKNKIEKEFLLIQKIESYQERKKSLINFLKKEKVENRAEIVSIDDFFGPTLKKDLNIDAIIVSENLIKGAEKINQEREKIGLPKLVILIKHLIKSKDEKTISSTRIRKGEINRSGRPYLNPLWLSKKLLLAKVLRRRLKMPLGPLFQNEIESLKNLNNSYLIAVGDVITKSFNKISSSPKISVVDFYVARKRIFNSFEELGFKGEAKVINVKNRAGFLTPEIFKASLTAFQFLGGKKNVIIKVEGEEDLAVLPIILASPLDFSVFYGQPDKGVVRIDITEKNKEMAYQFINNFIVVS